MLMRAVRSLTAYDRMLVCCPQMDVWRTRTQLVMQKHDLDIARSVAARIDTSS